MPWTLATLLCTEIVIEVRCARCVWPVLCCVFVSYTLSVDDPSVLSLLMRLMIAQLCLGLCFKLLCSDDVQVLNMYKPLNWSLHTVSRFCQLSASSLNVMHLTLVHSNILSYQAVIVLKVSTAESDTIDAIVSWEVVGMRRFSSRTPAAAPSVMCSTANWAGWPIGMVHPHSWHRAAVTVSGPV